MVEMSHGIYLLNHFGKYFLFKFFVDFGETFACVILKKDDKV